MKTREKLTSSKKACGCEGNADNDEAEGNVVNEASVRHEVNVDDDVNEVKFGALSERRRLSKQSERSECNCCCTTLPDAEGHRGPLSFAEAVPRPRWQTPLA